MRLLCLTSNEFCTAADPDDVRTHVRAHFEHARTFPLAADRPYTVHHVGTGAFVKHDKAHFQSDHQYVWAVMDVRTAHTAKSGPTPTDADSDASYDPVQPLTGDHVDPRPGLVVACFQEMFDGSRNPLRKTQRRTADYIGMALGDDYVALSAATAKGLVGEANKDNPKKMGMGVYVWAHRRVNARVTYTGCPVRKSLVNTKRLVKLEVHTPALTVHVGNAHLPMDENLYLHKPLKNVANPMKQKERNQMLTKVLAAMRNAYGKRVWYGTPRLERVASASTSRRSKRRSRSSTRRPRSRRHPSRGGADPTAYVQAVRRDDMLSGKRTDQPPTFAKWDDVVYRWLTDPTKMPFCPTCELGHPLAKREIAWADVPDVPRTPDPEQWTTEAASSPYKLVKKEAYNVPSYCDRLLVRVDLEHGRPVLRLLMGDLNYRVLPRTFYRRLGQG